jgi:hypothetical protein
MNWPAPEVSDDQDEMLFCNPVEFHRNILGGGCSSPIRCARHEKDFFLLSASSSIWDCRLIRRPAKMLAENVNRALAGLHQKMALESTLRLHNDGAARRVSAGIESGLHASP